MANILIVDDEEPLREALALFFGDEGHQMFTASNGVQALEVLAKAELG
jgi:DNA-binding response OmpR family regulator